MANKQLLRITSNARGRANIAAHVAVSVYTLYGSSFYIDLAMGDAHSETGGNNSPVVVAKKKFELGFANPAGLARMALLGRGCFKEKLPLRALGVFPSWDRLVFAVHQDTGIRSIEEIKDKKFPLRVSTRQGGKEHTTLYIVDEILKAYGFSLRDIEKWGGKILRVPNPSSTVRTDHLKNGLANAVFDEGLKSWGAVALQSGMRFLPIDETVLKKMAGLGFSAGPVTSREFSALPEEVATLDFSGWPFFCHRDLPAKTVYQIATAIDACHANIPVDHFGRKRMTMEEFTHGSEGGPLTLPFHPGVRKYYREKGYI